MARSTGCPSGKKWALASEQLAINTAKLLTWAEGIPFYPYDCPDCPDWHVTRSKQHSDDSKEAGDAETTAEDPPLR